MEKVLKTSGSMVQDMLRPNPFPDLLGQTEVGTTGLDMWAWNSSYVRVPEESSVQTCDSLALLSRVNFIPRPAIFLREKIHEMRCQDISMILGGTCFWPSDYCPMDGSVLIWEFVTMMPQRSLVCFLEETFDRFRHGLHLIQIALALCSVTEKRHLKWKFLRLQLLNS